MEIHIQKGLSTDAEYIRTEVFIKEQGFCKEFDEIDQKAYHFILYEQQQAAATARLFQNDGVWTIGRVAVLKKYRGLHLGTALMRHVISFSRKQNITQLTLYAQLHALPFYESLGFCAFGQPMEDEGVTHRAMRLFL